MRVILKLLVYSMFILYFFPAITCANHNETIIEAGILEWGEGYLKASEGFTLWYDGKYLSGNELYLDLKEKNYFLSQSAFTACKKIKPHYQIIARRVAIFNEDKIVFSGVKVKVGELQLPIPVDLTLEYSDGLYHYPDWLPHVFLSSQDGLGIQWTISKMFFDRLQTSTAILAAVSGKYELALDLSYRVSDDLTFFSKLAYNQAIESEVGIEFGSNKQEFSGKVGWSRDKKDIEKWEMALDYQLNSWLYKFVLNQNTSSKLIPSFIINSPMYNYEGINLKVTLDVTQVTERSGNKYHDKIYTETMFSHQFNLSGMKLGWQLEPGYTWISGHNHAYSIKSQVWGQITLGPEFNISLKYGRADFWGEVSPELSGFSISEYLDSTLAYHKRNWLDEGWDLELSGRYDLINQKFLKADSRIVRAYDCFDIELGIGIVRPSINIKLTLKY